MSKNDLIELTGTVDEVLPGSMYRVKIDNMQSIITCYTGGKLKQHKIKIILGDRVKLDDMQSVITCYTGGKLKQHKIKIILGDKVKVEVSAYDLTKGRVTYRL